MRKNRGAAAVGHRRDGRRVAEGIREDRVAGPGELFVAAHELRPGVDVDDVADRQVGQLLERRQHLL